MKRLLTTLFCLSLFFISNAQSNTAIAKVYINRAEESLNNIRVKESKEHFEKAVKYLDTITSADIAKLGMKIYYELREYEEAKKYAAYYFDLEKNSKSQEFIDLVELSVSITEEYEAQLEEQQRLEEERLRKEKELRKIDSLKTIWKTKAAALSFQVDSIYSFNKNGVAVFKDKDFFGIINDNGELLVEANEYKDFLSFDGFIILKSDSQNPNKLYSYNTSSKTGFVLPSISDFNTLSTNYGKVMLPRGNGRLVSYPNNSKQAMVYDLNLRKFVKVSNEQDLFKNLKRADVIDKYKDDGRVKYDGEWYIFGGHLGGGIHPLYAEDGYVLKGFLCSLDGKFLNVVSDYQYIGFFYNAKYQAVKGTQVYWVNQNGTKVDTAIDEAENYTGKSQVKKSETGAYQIIKDGKIVSGNQKLEKMVDFLRKFSGTE